MSTATATPQGIDPHLPSDWEIRYRKARIHAFALTWCAYAGFYLCRKNLSVLKDPLAEAFALTNTQLGAIDTGYLIAYAIGQFISGTLGDRFGGKKVVGIGLIFTALMNLCFGFGQGFLFFLVPWVLNGFAQSSGWPGCTKSFSDWFARGERGSAMGFWLTCYQAGPVIATLLATTLLVHFGWQSALFGPALIIFGFALLFKWKMPGSPQTEGLPHVEVYHAHKHNTEMLVADNEEDAEDDNWQHVRLVLTSRPIWTLGLSYVVLKFIRYSLLFWLPFYMAQELKYETGEAGYTSIAFDVAGVLGVILAGLISDRLFKSRRAPPAVIMMLLLAVATFAYTEVSGLGKIENLISIAVLGFLLYGPDALISGVAAVDFGHGRASALAAGFVNGLGSIGGALSGVVVGYVSELYGWSSVFMIFSPLCIVGALLMSTLWNTTPETENAKA
ncbi:MAG: hypothetical protein CMH56_07720 [Myxococcales bacterium]|nr:hypothetical protein [Myxococcales bacterium]